MHPFFYIFGHSIPAYAIMIIFGMMVANILAFVSIRKKKFCIDDFLMMEAYVMLGAMLGAKGLYLWINREEIQWNNLFALKYFNQLMRGGFVFYGGLIGGFFSLFVAGRFHKLNLVLYIREFVYLIPLIHGFGRIGCFLAGCCYGIEYDGIFHVIFPKGGFAPEGIALFPVQLVEALGLFMLSLLVYLVKEEGKPLKPLYVYLLGYSGLRFLLEFFRADDRGALWIFSTSQWISVFCVFLLGAGFIVGKIKNNCKKGEHSV